MRRCVGSEINGWWGEYRGARGRENNGLVEAAMFVVSRTESSKRVLGEAWAKTGLAVQAADAGRCAH